MHDLPLSNRYRLQRAIMRLPGLVAYYPLNEAEGSVARNYAPATRGSLDGTITGATVGQPGKAGRAYSFDGVNDVVNTNNDYDFSGTKNFTIFLVMRYLTQVNSFPRIVSKSRTIPTPDYVRFLVFSSTNTLDAGRTINNVGKSASVVLTPNTDYFCALTYNGTNSRLYLNGATPTVGPSDTEAFSSFASNIAICAEVGGNSPFTGLAQHFALFDRALTDTECLKLAQIAGLA